MSSLLIEDLPTSISSYPIAWTARDMIEMQQILLDPEIGNTQKVLDILHQFYPSGYGHLSQETAWSYFIWFLGCGDTRNRERLADRARDNSRAYDFSVDGPMTFPLMGL